MLTVEAITYPAECKLTIEDQHIEANLGDNSCKDSDSTK
jgi:hypothetical protein